MMMMMMMMMMTEMVFETLVQYGHLTGLRAREDYINFSRRESSKTYVVTLCSVAVGYQRLRGPRCP
jgi:hypothetical protein